MKDLDKLCLDYGFSWDVIGEYVRIKSKYDSWAVKSEHINRDKMILYHFNSKGGSGLHHQGKYKSLKSVFEYLDNHDNKANFSFSQAFRIQSKLKELGA